MEISNYIINNDKELDKECEQLLREWAEMQAETNKAGIKDVKFNVSIIDNKRCVGIEAKEVN